jgi:hypothetical protein
MDPFKETLTANVDVLSDDISVGPLATLVALADEVRASKSDADRHAVSVRVDACIERILRRQT